MKTVVIVVPISKPTFTADERVSLAHLTRFLGHYPIVFAAPKNLKVDFAEYPVLGFSRKYFKRPKDYNRLLTSPEFYRRFLDYEYILFYQPEALVFSDRLSEWCKKGYDYVAAPWPQGEGAKFVDPASLGNGGFSLHKTESFLRVLAFPQQYWQGTFWKFLESVFDFQKITSSPRDWYRNIRHVVRGAHASSGDYFGLFEAIKRFYQFKVAPPEEAFLFSFEVDPRWNFKQNGGRLPFGCHDWTKHREFWQPYLLK